MTCRPFAFLFSLLLLASSPAVRSIADSPAPGDVLAHGAVWPSGLPWALISAESLSIEAEFPEEGFPQPLSRFEVLPDGRQIGTHVELFVRTDIMGTGTSEALGTAPGVELWGDASLLPDGSLLAVDRQRFGIGGSTTLHRLRPGESVAEPAGNADDLGLLLATVTVPRSGPSEGDALTVACDLNARTIHLLWWRLQPDGSLLREAPSAALALFDVGSEPRVQTTCDLYNGSALWFFYPATAFAPGGESVFLGDGCRNRIIEYGLDGTLRRIVVELDPGALRPNAILDLVANPDGSFWVGRNRQLDLIASDGTLIGRAPISSSGRNGTIGPAIGRPFESSGPCEPRSMGFWKRQCLGEGEARRDPGGRSRSLGGVGLPRLHPEFRDGERDLETVLESADELMVPTGLKTCEALWPERPQEARARALGFVAAVRCNQADRRIHRGCLAEWEGELVTFGELLPELDSLLAEPLPDWRTIHRLASTLIAAAEKD